MHITFIYFIKPPVFLSALVFSICLRALQGKVVLLLVHCICCYISTHKAWWGEYMVHLVFNQFNCNLLCSVNDIGLKKIHFEGRLIKGLVTLILMMTVF